MKYFFKSLLGLLFLFSMTLKAQSPIAELEQKLASTNVDSNKVKILYKLALSYSTTEPKKTLALSEEAIACARKSGSLPFLVSALMNFGNMLTYISEFKASAIYLREALDLCKSNELYSKEASVLNNLGTLYNCLDVPTKALTYFKEAREIAMKHNLSTILSVIDCNIGLIYSNIGDHEKAIPLYQESIDRLKKYNNLGYLNEWANISRGYVNLSKDYIETYQYTNAQVAIDSALYYAQKDTTKKDVYLYSVINQASLYIASHAPEKAITLVLAAINNPKYSSIPTFEQYYLYYNLGEAYLTVNQFNEALKYAQLSHDLQKDDIYSDLSLESGVLLAKCYAGLNNYPKAYELAERFHTIRDTLNARNEKQRITLSLVEHEIEGNEKALTEANDHLKITTTIYKTIGIAAIPLIALIVFALFYRYRLRLQKQHSMGLENKVTERTKDLEIAHIQIQEAKERENISLALLNQQHSELLELTIEKMQNWQKQNTFSEIQTTINDLKAAQTKADEWGSFMLHFERIHPNFAQSLQTQFPELNANDLKHCAYMRLGMTRKQVADNLHTTENAVRLARNRIRKKMGLEADDSLQGFLDQWGQNKDVQ